MKLHQTDQPNLAANPHGYAVEHIPERHVLKTEYLKTCEKGGGFEDKKDQNWKPLALKIYLAIGKAYYPINGAPYAKKQDCLKLAKSFAHDLDRLKKAFAIAWTSQKALEDKTGQRTRYPWRLLDQTAQILIDDGIRPREEPDND